MSSNIKVCLSCQELWKIQIQKSAFVFVKKMEIPKKQSVQEASHMAFYVLKMMHLLSKKCKAT